MDIRFVGEGTNKHAQVDFTKFDRAAERWLDGAHFNTFQLPLRGMGGGTFYSRELGELEGFKEGTPEFARLFQDYLSQIETHLEQRGWLSKAFTYWFDEPAPKDFEFVVEGMKRLNAAAPGIKRMLTIQPEPPLLGHVEIWCGLTPKWTPEIVSERRQAGEQVWWYICCGPHAPYVTEFIDHPGTELRLWPWQSWQYGVQGILIWATTYWTSPTAFPPPKLQDPWTDPMSYVTGYGKKPGEIGIGATATGGFCIRRAATRQPTQTPCLDGPVNSLRWENLRDGMEDYEYFWLLQRSQPGRTVLAWGDRFVQAGTRAVEGAERSFPGPDPLHDRPAGHAGSPRPRGADDRAPAAAVATSRLMAGRETARRLDLAAGSRECDTWPPLRVPFTAPRRARMLTGL